MVKNEPAHKFRIGRISVVIWRNRSEQGSEWYRTEITRKWKKGEEWQDSTSYNLEDLLVVSHAAMLAGEWIWQQKVAKSQEAVVEVE